MTDLRAYQPSFTAGELAPALWARVDLSKYNSGMKHAENVILHPHGGVSNRPGFQFIRQAKNAASQNVILIPFQFNTEQSYMLEFGHTYMRVYKNGGIVLSGGSPYELTTPYAHTQLGELTFIQEADVMYLCHPSFTPRKLSRTADNNWSINAMTFGPKIPAPTGVAATALVGGSTPTTYYYRVAAIDDATGEESLPSAAASAANDLTVAGRVNRVTWNAVAGASRYVVYKHENGVYGYIGGTTNTQFDDRNITPDLSDTTQIARNPFSGAGNFPRCATFIEQRLAFGGTLNDPQAVWMSQTANYENFGYSRPLKASDAVTFRIKAQQVNEIRSMLPTKGLMIMTSGAEWLVTGGSQSDAITPTAIDIKNQGYRGSSRVQPIIVGNTILFAQERGAIIRDFSYDFAEDGYQGKDLTILSRHLFDGKSIKSWAFQQVPNSIVWVILDDGSLVSLTYLKEHDVWGWTRHSSPAGAKFHSVAVIGEGNEDVPYFVVERTIGGTQVKYIERLHTRHFTDVKDAFFVDSGLTYTGSPTSTLSGLSHLNGQTVAALVDGNVVRNLTVSGGSVTLPVAGSKIHIGLPYEAKIQTLDLDLGAVQGLGTVQGRKKTVAAVTLRVEKTRGIWVAPKDVDRSSDKIVEYKQRSVEAWNEPIQLYTGDIEITSMWDWSNGANMWVKQFDPLPMTVLAIMPDVLLGK